MIKTGPKKLLKLLIALLTNANRIDVIISGITTLVKQLDIAANFHKSEAAIQQNVMNLANNKMILHNAEVERALALKAKIQGLITV